MANKSTRLPGTEFESTGNRARSVAAGSPGSAGLNRSIATDIGAGALVALEAIQKANIERDSVASVKAETAAVTSAEKAMSELDPMAADYPERVKQIWGEASKTAMETSGITTSIVRNDLERRFTRHAAGAELIGIKLRKDAVSKESLLTAKDAMNATSAKIRNDPGNANNYLAEHQADMERLKAGMDPNTLRAFSRQAADEFAKNQVIGYAEKGNFAGARSAIKAQAEHLDTSVVTGLSNYVDGKESKARADGDRARTQNIATYLVDVDDQFSGNKEINPNNRANLDAMKAKGAISPEGYLTAVRTLNNREEALRKDQAKDAVALEEFNTGTPKNQENLDRAVNIALGRIPIGRIAIEGTPEQRATAIKVMAGIAGTSGMLYGQFKDLLENSDKTTDKSRAGQVAFAAEAADDLENTAPRALDNAKLNPTGTLMIVRSEAKRLIEQGVPKQEAYKQAAGTYMSKGPLTIQEENDRKAVLQKDISKIDFRGMVETSMTSWGERNIPLVKLPGQDAALQGEARRAYEAAYMRTGSTEQAEAIAKTTLNQIYGTTMVGAVGKPFNELDPKDLENRGMDPAGRRSQIARRPIERYSPPSMRAMPQEDQARIYQNQIEPGLKTAGINLVKDPKFPHLSSYRLVADNQTEQDLREGRLPTYQVQVLRVGGEGEYYNVDGMKRFRPPTEAEVLQDPTYIEINNARLMNDMKARQFDVRQQTEKARNTERMGNRPPLRRGAE
jgi:mono/diheme cytochrome c family protein